MPKPERNIEKYIRVEGDLYLEPRPDGRVRLMDKVGDYYYVAKDPTFDPDKFLAALNKASEGVATLRVPTKFERFRGRTI